MDGRNNSAHGAERKRIETMGNTRSLRLPDQVVTMTRGELARGLSFLADDHKQAERMLVFAMRNAHKQGISYARIARIVNMHPHTVARVCERGYLIRHAH